MATWFGHGGREKCFLRAIATKNDNGNENKFRRYMISILGNMVEMASRFRRPGRSRVFDYGKLEEALRSSSKSLSLDSPWSILPDLQLENSRYVVFTNIKTTAQYKG